MNKLARAGLRVGMGAGMSLFMVGLGNLLEVDRPNEAEQLARIETCAKALGNTSMTYLDLPDECRGYESIDGIRIVTYVNGIETDTVTEYRAPSRDDYLSQEKNNIVTDDYREDFDQKNDLVVAGIGLILGACMLPRSRNR